MNPRPSIPPTTPPLILCIDDADVALRVRKILLGTEGYNVLTASSGKRAWKFSGKFHRASHLRPLSNR